MSVFASTSMAHAKANNPLPFRKCAGIAFVSQLLGCSCAWWLPNDFLFFVFFAGSWSVLVPFVLFALTRFVHRRALMAGLTGSTPPPALWTPWVLAWSAGMLTSMIAITAAPAWLPHVPSGLGWSRVAVVLPGAMGVLVALVALPIALAFWSSERPQPEPPPRP